MKTRNVTILIAGLVIVVLIFIHMFSPIVEPTKPRQKLRAAAQIRGLGVILSTIKDNPLVSQLSRNTNDNVKLNGGQIFELLSEKSNALVKLPDTDWEKSHRFTDPWGQDYFFIFKRDTNATQNMEWILTIRSIGANGVDENGSGDDITGENIKVTP